MMIVAAPREVTAVRGALAFTVPRRLPLTDFLWAEERGTMAEGRELGPQSPRWVNALIWSTGLGALACFIWSAFSCDAEPHAMPPSLTTVLPRIIGCAMLPLLLAVATIERAAKRVFG